MLMAAWALHADGGMGAMLMAAWALHADGGKGAAC